MRTVLLTGFEPFDQDTVNPSWEAVRLLDGTLQDDTQIIARQLPCTFAGAPERLSQLLQEFTPTLVIAVGLGPGDGAYPGDAGCAYDVLHDHDLLEFLAHAVREHWRMHEPL